MKKEEKNEERRQPDIDICSACGEHAEFHCCGESEEGAECLDSCRRRQTSNCCGAGFYDSDPDLDMER